MSLDTLLSLQDSRPYLGMGLTRIYAEISAGRLQVIKSGRRTLISESEIRRFTATLPRAGRKDALQSGEAA